MLKGSAVVLRAPLERDLELWIALRNNIGVQMQLMALPHANSVQRVRDWISTHISDPHTAFFAIARSDSNEAVGFIQLREMDFLHGSGQLGICVDASGQGKGYAMEALRLLEDYVQDVFGIRKILLSVLADNERAIAFYVKSGYRAVGVYRQHFYQRRKYHDVQIMEKLLSSLRADEP